MLLVFLMMRRKSSTFTKDLKFGWMLYVEIQESLSLSNQAKVFQKYEFEKPIKIWNKLFFALMANIKNAVFPNPTDSSLHLKCTKHVDFEGVAGAVKFAEFMKRKAKKKIENQELVYALIAYQKI